MKAEPHYLKHRRRVKNKFKKTCFEGWHDHEILELLLFYTISRKDTKQIAKKLLEKFGSIVNVMGQEARAFKGVDGVGEHTALFFKVIKELTQVYLKRELSGKDLVSCPEAAYDYLKALLKGAGDEEFHALFLNSSNRLIAAEKINSGTVNKTAVFPRKIVERALQNKASGVIVSHNHPGGSLKASEEDRKTTLAIKNALDSVDIDLLDHIIIAGNQFLSMKEGGLGF
jgi:DNA repair protein RadC